MIAGLLHHITREQSSKAAAERVAKQTQAKSTTKHAELMQYLTSGTDPLVSAATARVVQLLPCCFLTNQLCLAHRSEEVSLQAAAILLHFTGSTAVDPCQKVPLNIRTLQCTGMF